MKIERYQVYKDSGFEWLGEVPEHWEVVRAKDICQIFVPQRDKPYLNVENGTAWITSDLLKNTKIDSGKVKYFVDQEEIKCKRIRKVPANSVLATCVGEFSLTAINKLPIVINQQIQAYSYIKNQSPEFINYQIQANITRLYYEKVATETTIKYINKEKFSFTPLYLPPLPEQKTIANYLDTKTAQIDRKIDLLTQKATLYGNLKQSLINETVTRGLDKSVPMKDSGIEWLGEIPEHWTLNRHKDNFIFINKRCNDLKLTKVGLENIESKTGRFIDTETEFDGEGIEFVKNDILFGKLRPYLAKVYLAEFTGNAIGDIFVYRLKQNIYPKFTQYLMISSRYIDVINSSTIGAKMPRVSSSFIAELIVAMPPLPEQKAIADYLDTKTAQIDQIIQTINTQIEKLKEFRKTLINDVVTGKIKV